MEASILKSRSLEIRGFWAIYPDTGLAHPSLIICALNIITLAPDPGLGCADSFEPGVAFESLE
jgi:hypothetical protein